MTEWNTHRPLRLALLFKEQEKTKRKTEDEFALHAVLLWHAPLCKPQHSAQSIARDNPDWHVAFFCHKASLNMTFLSKPLEQTGGERVIHYLSPAVRTRSNQNGSGCSSVHRRALTSEPLARHGTRCTKAGLNRLRQGNESFPICAVLWIRRKNQPRRCRYQNPTAFSNYEGPKDRIVHSGVQQLYPKGLGDDIGVAPVLCQPVFLQILWDKGIFWWICWTGEMVKYESVMHCVQRTIIHHHSNWICNTKQRSCQTGDPESKGESAIFSAGLRR